MSRATREPGTTLPDEVAEDGDVRDDPAGGDVGAGVDDGGGTRWTAHPIADAEPEAGGGGGDDDLDDDEDDDGPGGAGLSWARALTLGAALAFLGFGVGMVVAQDRPPGEDSVDVGFYQDMVTHHEQALGVATVTIGNGSDPVIRSLAREVLTFQSQEVGVMRQTLADWGHSTADRPDEAMGWMDDMGPVPVEDMPGFLTDEQVDSITQAEGAEADALFLELMAEHHRGGMHMAMEAAETADDDGVRTMAERMVENQAHEIEEYRQWALENGYDVDIEPVEVPADLAG
jgi:uncharacterized protein (DUF305 family)